MSIPFVDGRDYWPFTTMPTAEEVYRVFNAAEAEGGTCLRAGTRPGRRSCGSANRGPYRQLTVKVGDKPGFFRLYQRTGVVTVHVPGLWKHDGVVLTAEGAPTSIVLEGLPAA